LYKGKEINLCIPTLNRYDLLTKCVLSAVNGTVKPTQILIIDNGCKLERPNIENLHVYNFGKNIGVAASWNFFIKNTAEYRIICNDDVDFFEDTIEILLNASDENCVAYPGAVPSDNAFSCFVIPDKIVNIVGYFDEKISPNYAYFEDNDYFRRMNLAGYSTRRVFESRLNHIKSSTLHGFTIQEQNQHHFLFRKARENYIRKWGGIPGEERLIIPKTL